jgi:hypothetical protein
MLFSPGDSRSVSAEIGSSTQNPCGNVNIADTLDSTTASHMGPKGHYRANITNFNG